MKEDVAVKGIVTFRVLDENNDVVRTVTHDNLVTDAGKNYFVKKIIEDPSIVGSAISNIAVGDGTTAPDTSDTSLENEVARLNISFISANDNVGEFFTTIAQAVATGTISEAGLYTNDDSPILVSRIVLNTPFTKLENESIQISWRFKIGSDS